MFQTSFVVHSRRVRILPGPRRTRIILRVAWWQKMGFATWQLVLLVAKSDPYLPRTVARVVRTAGGLIRPVFHL